MLPPAFESALRDARLYPLNTALKTVEASPHALSRLSQTLDASEKDLFNDTSCHIPFRDLSADIGADPVKYTITCDAELKSRLGLPLASGPAATIKKDPKCRFICFHAPDSRSPLKLNRSLVGGILTFHQVMPCFLEFLAVFGRQDEAKDPRFTGFRELIVLGHQSETLAIPDLGRSGKHYQLCYNIKSVVNKGGEEGRPMFNPWSTRQAAVHHQFDVASGNALWIVAKGNLDLQRRFTVMTKKKAPVDGRSFATTEECFRSSLATHLLFCLSATEDWRGYVQWLEKKVANISELAVKGLSGAGHAFEEYTPQNIQDLQTWEEAETEAIAAMQGNIDIMAALVGFYRRLSRNKNFPLRQRCADDIDDFGSRLGSIIMDLRLQLHRAGSLVKKTSDRRELVLQHLQSQSAYRMEKLSKKMEQEQIVMLIITAVTLIYLPATFVSTFFSTDIIKYQDQDSPGGSYSETAMMRWLQVTLPLTLLTGLLAWYARRWMQRRASRDDSHSRRAPVRLGRGRAVRARLEALLLGGRPQSPILPLHSREK